MYDLSVVIPAYNEEKKLSKDIEAVYNFFKKNSINGELIVVDDGSRDKTYNIAQEYKNKFPTLKLINYGNNQGKGFAIKTGILEAQGEYILFADSGVCVPYQYASKGIKLLESGYDIAIGSRRDKKAKVVVQQPFYRRFGSIVFQLLITIFDLIPAGIKDTQCGFKLFKKEIAHKIYKECFTKGFMIDIEMLRRANKQKYKIVPFPIEWTNDPDTRYNPVVGSFENMLQIVKIILLT